MTSQAHPVLIRDKAAPVQSLVQYSDDEISLVDLWLILAKHKKCLIGALVATAILGGAVALLLPKTFSFTTTIEVGTRMDDRKNVPIESVESVLAKLKNSYIPYALREYAQSKPEGEKLYKVTASIPGKSQTVLLTSKGRENEAGTYKTLHEEVANSLKQDHGRIMDVIRGELVLDKNRQQRALEANEEQNRILQAELKRIDVTAKLMRKQIKEAEGLIVAANQNRRSAIREAKDEARAMTLLMLDNEVQQNRNRLAGLEERLHVSLIDKRDKLKKALADNRRAYLNIKDNVSRLELKITNLQETRAVYPATQSIDPTGIGKKAVVLMALIAGLLVGVFGAFFLEFLEKVREADSKVAASPENMRETDSKVAALNG
jgi:hypothetical protein